MKNWPIKQRILMVAVLPLLVTVVVLTLFYVYQRTTEIEQALRDRGQTIVSHLGPALEYGLFSGNRQVVEQLATQTLRQPDVVSVVIRDHDGKEVFRAVSASSRSAPEEQIHFSGKVRATDVGGDDLFGGLGAGDGAVLGSVELVMDLAATRKQQEQVVLLALIFSLVLFSLTVSAAMYLVRDITDPMRRLVTGFEKITKGDLGFRLPLTSTAELGRLEAALNVMAESLQQAEGELRRRYQTLFNASGDAVFLIHDGIVVDCNSRALSLLRGQRAQIVGHALDEFSAMADGQAESGALARQIQHALAEESGIFEWRFVNHDGDEIYSEISLARTELRGEPHVLVLMRDISDRKRAQELLEHQANFDAITGLPNRVLAQDRLEQSIRMAHRDQTHVGVLFIDIDRFKNVNDTLGHSAGDRLLIAIADRLCKVVREGDTVARLGGDEFLVILNELREPDAAAQVATKIIETIANPFPLNEREVYVGASVGITLYPQDGDEYPVLLRNADAAMYRAKQEGRNTYRFYTQDIGQQAHVYVEMDGHLRQVLEREELELFFQPQVRIADGAIVGAEALLRWRNGRLGEVAPSRFIPLAEETGLIVPIGNWVLRQAFTAASDWRRRGLPPIRLAVNISGRQIKEPNFIVEVRSLLAAFDVPVTCLEFEITESLLIENAPATVMALRDLKQTGIRLSLDDFGVGYSSLGYLKRYPFDAIKIDRSFIRDIEHDASDAALCDAIIAMGERLGLQVVGEGVETEKQLQFLKQHGAGLAQGYHIAEPMPLAQFEAFVRDYGDKAVTSLG